MVKNKKYHSILFIVLFLCMHAMLMAQDIHFSQFFETPLLRNPSLAGIFKGDYRLQMVYRDQWRTVTDGYKTGSLNGEYKFSIGKADDYLTAGGQILFDRAGTASLTQTSLSPVINYHKSLSATKNRYLSLGFMGGIVNRYFDRSKITTNSSYNGGPDDETTVATNYTYVDGSVGLSYNAGLSQDPEDNFYVGAAYHHFTKPRNSFFRDPSIQLNPKWVTSAGFRFGVTDFSFVTLQADHSIQNKYQETIIGGMYGMKIGEETENARYILTGGAFLRWNDAVIPVIKLDYSGFSFAFSYDVNISSLKPASLGHGGFEFSVSYIGWSKKSSSVDAMFCPKF